MDDRDAHIGSVAKAAVVLEALSRHGEGATLAQLVAGTELNKTTVFRVLAALQDVRYVWQDPLDRRYRMGEALSALSRKANIIHLTALAQMPLTRLAQVTADTVFLSLLEGTASLCVARVLGAFPIRTLSLAVGDRHPLGVGAGALALHCALPEDRALKLVQVNTAWLSEFGIDDARLAAKRAEYARIGFAHNDSMIIKEMAGIGMPVLRPSGMPAAAVSIGAVNDRMGAERIRTVLLPALRAAVAEITALLAHMEAEAAAGTLQTPGQRAG
ncbi:MAG: IclR family transcriptional regulator [Rhodobacter sp.]|nr:IclR family transcriptional regulator [Rhodobacter sp.]MCE2750169.1 IclR family transcriptional regulator [Rhodobacter sp.]